jgi:hypothetical protein
MSKHYNTRVKAGDRVIMDNTNRSNNNSNRILAPPPTLVDLQSNHVVVPERKHVRLNDA